VSYRVFDHTADLGIEVFGKTKEEVYAGAAMALFDLLTEPGRVRKALERTIAADGEDDAELLVNFLREVLYAWTGDGFLVAECAVREAGPRRITAVLRGEPFDPARHRIRQEIKAVTHHQASLRRAAAGWEARIVFDV
jgi:SHS2 domain-containing protein